MTKIVARIKNLMALAEDQAGLPEGERAADIAAKLMREHAISMATVQMDVEEKIESDDNIPLGHAYWKRDLWMTLGIHCNCMCSYYRSSRYGIIFGKQSDIEVCHYLFDIICQQINREAKLYLNDLPDWYDRGDKKRKGNSFRRSATDGVSAKLREIREAGLQKDAAGTALVLKRGKEAEEAYMARYYPKGTKSSGGSYRSDRYSRCAAGFEAGKNVSLSRGLSDGGRSQQKRLK